jgi:ubiquinone/menaquinone biosynthesis C-methylase UbiE
MTLDSLVLQHAKPGGCGGIRTGDVVTTGPFGDRRAVASDPLSLRSRLTWTSGDFARIATGFADGAAAFVDRLSLSRGERTLDVACGTGNLTLPAARAGAVVTGLDIAPNLLERARISAIQSGVTIQFDEGDAECLPYASGSFATVVSMFGVMFAPRPERALSELFRVTRGGGRIALANWTPAGFIGEMLRAHAALVPPPDGVPSVLHWGDSEIMSERLASYGSRIRSVSMTPRTIALEYPLSPGGVVELFRDAYGPSVRAFAGLDEDGRAKLYSDLKRLWKQHNSATQFFTQVHAEYLDVRIDLASS